MCELLGLKELLFLEPIILHHLYHPIGTEPSKLNYIQIIWYLPLRTTFRPSHHHILLTKCLGNIPLETGVSQVNPSKYQELLKCLPTQAYLFRKFLSTILQKRTPHATPALDIIDQLQSFPYISTCSTFVFLLYNPFLIEWIQGNLTLSSSISDKLKKFSR